jgi:hypothetical protein
LQEKIEPVKNLLMVLWIAACAYLCSHWIVRLLCAMCWGGWICFHAVYAAAVLYVPLLSLKFLMAVAEYGTIIPYLQTGLPADIFYSQSTLL